MKQRKSACCFHSRRTQSNTVSKNWNRLLFNDLKDLHGTSLYADSAGDALGSGIFRLQNHDMHGAGFHTLTAANALLLVDHVNTSLGVLGNRLMLAGAHALATLNTGLGLCSGSLGNNADAGQSLIELFVERFRAGTDTLQTSHTFCIFFYSELFHTRKLSFTDFVPIIIPSAIVKCN